MFTISINMKRQPSFMKTIAKINKVGQSGCYTDDKDPYW